MRALVDAFQPIVKFFLQRKRDRAFARQKWSELAETSRRILKIDPGDFRALHDLAVALSGLRDYDGAVSACEKAFAAAPKVRADLQFAAEGPRYMRYLTVYAKVLLQKNELEKARRVLEQLKKMGHHFHEKFLLLSRVYKRQERLAAAAAELEGMQALYEKRTREWETLIRANSLAILERAVERRDADAALFCLRTIVRSALHTGSLENALTEVQGSPAATAITAGLRAFAALLEKRSEQARAWARKTAWPELEQRLEVLTFMTEARPDEAFALLRAFPADSPFHLEQLRLLKGTAPGRDPAFLRDSARCHLFAGQLEEAERALSALESAGVSEPEDIATRHEVSRLLLERDIWEDEKRLGLHPDREAELTSRVLPAAPDTAEFPFRGRTLRVRLSDAIRLGGDDLGPKEEEVRRRLTENLRRAGRPGSIPGK